MPTVDERLASLEAKVDAIADLRAELTRGFDQIRRGFDEIDKRFEQVDKRFEQVDKRFEQVDKRFEGVERRFELVDQRMERQFLWLVGLQMTGLIAVVTALITVSR